MFPRPAASRLVLFGAVLVSGHAAAEAPRAAQRVVLRSYEGVPSCPGPYTLTSQILARTDRVTFVEGSPADAFGLDVTLATTPQGFRGRAQLLRPGRPPELHELEAASCDEVVAGLGLMLALALDPQPEPAAPADVPPAAPPPTAPPPPRWGGALALVGGVSVPLQGRPAALLELGGLARRWTPRATPSPWRWGLGLRGERSLRPERIDGGGELQYSLLRLIPSVCRRLVRGARVEVLGCADASVGGLRLEATDDGRSESTWRPWLTVGLGPELAWHVSEGVSLRLSLGADLNGIRDEFVVAGGSAGETAPWSPRGQLGLSWGRVGGAPRPPPAVGAPE